MTINTLGLELLASHLVGDFCLQSDRLVQAKRSRRLQAFLFHAAMQAALAYVFAGLWRRWEIPLAIGAAHCFIDLFKEAVLQRLAPRNSCGKPITLWKFWSLVIDQAAHIGTIAALVWFLTTTNRIAAEPYWGLLIGQPLWNKSLMVLISIVTTVYVGGVLIGILVEPFLAELKGPDGQLAIDRKRGLENGGKRIGQLERALILLFVLSAQPASVGFLITAKSVFRFGELKEGDGRKEAEYIIIGTMLSFAWALTLAWATQYALHAI
jgi:hypothetical protein